VTSALAAVEAALLRRLRSTARRPFLLGICGAQGSGKSTLAAGLTEHLNQAGVGCATLSLDDLYKTRAARQHMAEELHRLFATRGVPGTHDLDLAFALIDALEAGQEGRLPRFDKGGDDRLPEQQWETAPADTQVLILEGWFVGARPEPEAALDTPVNRLERDEDPRGEWRRYANEALGGDYQRLFSRIDMLVLLAAPGFEVVRGWRTQQEQGLRAQGRGGMDDAQIARFVQYYERLTRHILAEMADRADLVIELDPNRAVRTIHGRI
jgi:D-glycerate 3-kinase